jgi:uncharacterized Zn finger protein
MPSVADLVEEPELRRRSTPAAYEEGARLADTGAVIVETFGPLEVRAGVEGRTVELRSADKGLDWSCTCHEGMGSTLCAHAVATAIETWRRSPARRDRM